ncbi:MAG: hypothetical protein AB1896_21060, partial [Thermodesulfobacteriota bacterium]
MKRFWCVPLFAAVLFLGLALAGVALAGEGIWTPVSLDGILSTNNQSAACMLVYGGQLYVGTGGASSGANVYRFNGTAWSQVGQTDLGDSTNSRVACLAAHQGYLYAGTYNSAGGRLYKLAGSTWTLVDSLGMIQPEVASLASDGTCLYYGSGGGTPGTAIVRKYCSGPADDTPAGLNPNATGFKAMVADGAVVYAGTANSSGPQVFRRSGGSWTDLSFSGSGFELGISALVMSGGQLYAGTQVSSPGKAALVWGYNNPGWSPLGPAGIDGSYPEAASLAAGSLYVGAGAGGSAVFMEEGGGWRMLNDNGFWDGNNFVASSMAVFNGDLYVGTSNSATGCEIWRHTWNLKVTLPPGSTVQDYKCISVPTNVGGQPLTQIL